MQAIIERCSLCLSYTVGGVNSLHPLRGQRVAIRITFHHINVMVFHERQVPGVVPALQTETDVHADDRIPRLCIEDQYLLEFSHRVLFTLFVKATCTALSYDRVPVLPASDANSDF